MSEVAAEWAIDDGGKDIGVVIFTDSTYQIAIDKADRLKETVEAAGGTVLEYVDTPIADTSVRMMDSDPDSASDFHQTPHLEELARRGMKFSCAYAPSPTCTPSRKSIQFGKTPGRLQYTFVHDVLALQRKLKWKDETSLADVVKATDANYVTAHFGKGMSGEQMKTIGYDITDEVDGAADNGNFHGEFVSLKNHVPLPPDNPKPMASLKKGSVP